MFGFLVGVGAVAAGYLLIRYGVVAIAAGITLIIGAITGKKAVTNHGDE